MAYLPIRIQIPTLHAIDSIDSIAFPSPIPLAIPTYTISLSLSFSGYCACSVSLVTSHHLANGHHRKSPCKQLVGRPCIPMSCATFVCRHPVLIASPISPMPLNMSSRSTHQSRWPHCPLWLWQRHSVCFIVII